MTYSVVRIRRGTRTVVASGLTWTEALTRRTVAEKEIRASAEKAAAKARTSVAIELERRG